MTRDLSEKQYLAALERRGFRPAGMARLWVKHNDFPNTMFGTIYDPRKGRIMRRATISKLIKSLDRERARKKAKLQSDAKRGED